MQRYDIKIFNRSGSRFRGRQLISSTDDAAIERLALFNHSDVLELWKSGRLVWRFDGRR